MNNFACFCVLFSLFWQSLVAQDCTGVATNCVKQFSPVKLSYFGAQKDQRLVDDPLRFTNYGNVTGEFKFYVANKALSFYPTIDPGNHPIPFIFNQTKPGELRRHLHPRIYGSTYGINGYILHRIDFRRGFDPDLQLGSDHLIDNSAAPLEVQFVHYNSRYNGTKDALGKCDGFAIVSFLFETTDDSGAPSTNYKQVASQMPPCGTENKSVNITLDLSKMIGESAKRGDGIFYRYQGSFIANVGDELDVEEGRSGENSECKPVSWTVYDRRLLILRDDLTKMNLPDMCLERCPTVELRGQAVKTNRVSFD